jgi:hypothetical protein
MREQFSIVVIENPMFPAIGADESVATSTVGASLNLDGGLPCAVKAIHHTLHPPDRARDIKQLPRF